MAKLLPWPFLQSPQVLVFFLRGTVDVTVAPAQKIYTVSELNAMVRQLFDTEPRFSRCYVAGEISNFKHHNSGHMYFTLKDESSRLRAVMFAGKNRTIGFRPEDGMRVVVIGSLSVFDRDGSYQIYVDEMQPDGIGALYVAFTQLKERLTAEGLFSDERKRALPRYPQRIGVVTSPTGAVIRDICSTLKRRYPHVKVVVSPAQVQGPTAAATIVRGIERLVTYSQRVQTIDVVIVARGGGSLEELWPFNEEVVARAIAASPIPVISAVGHETDFTIADFVADVRAATPTAAAELAAPTTRELRQQLTQYTHTLQTDLMRRLDMLRQRLAYVEQHNSLRDPLRAIAVRRQSVDYLESELRQSMHRPLRDADKALANLVNRFSRVELRSGLAKRQSELNRLQGSATATMKAHVAAKGSQFERTLATLVALNPLAVLARGYSVVYRSDGETVVAAARDLRLKEQIQVRFQDGTVNAQIVDNWGEEEDGQAIQSRLDL